MVKRMMGDIGHDKKERRFIIHGWKPKRSKPYIGKKLKCLM